MSMTKEILASDTTAFQISFDYAPPHEQTHQNLNCSLFQFQDITKDYINSVNSYSYRFLRAQST